jgi:hypothetical protein
MRKLKIWMRVVGGFYLFLGLFNLPPVVAARIDFQYSMLALPPDHVAVQAINDLWFVFGAETAVIGLMLLVGAIRPLRSKILVQTVLLLELVRVLLDGYWIARGYYDNAFMYAGFIVIHLAIAFSGWYALRQAASGPRAAAAEATLQSGKSSIPTSV